jgi:Mce-associated membrane protein
MAEEADEADRADRADEADRADGAGPADVGPRPARRVLIAGLAVLAALVGLNGVLGYRNYQSRHADQVRSEMVEAARQGAINLTTIDHERVDQDVQRILDSSTGSFRDDFAARAKPFSEAARRAQSKSVGTVTEAGLEEVSGDEGRVLVAMTVMTSNRGVPEQQPQGWRMRVTVIRVDDEAKVSKVEFVP